MDGAPGRRHRRVGHVFGEPLLRSVDQDVGVLGLEGEVQIEPGERGLEFADRLATPVAPGDAHRMQERQGACENLEPPICIRKSKDGYYFTNKIRISSPRRGRSA